MAQLFWPYGVSQSPGHNADWSIGNVRGTTTPP